MARPREECGCHRRRRAEWKKDAKYNVSGRSRRALSVLTVPAGSIVGYCNISPVGACLEVSSQVGIPNAFVLGSATRSSSRRAMWSGVRTRAWVWNFALSASKATVDRDQAAATPAVSARPDLAQQLVDRQPIPWFSAARQTRVSSPQQPQSFCASSCSSCVFLRRPLLFDPQPRITMVTIWLGTSRAGANQCHDGWACFGRGLRSEF
jgi:hypothetical protein